MSENKAYDFAERVSRLMPVMLREASKQRMTGFTSGKISLPFVTVIEFLKEKGECNMGELATVLDLSMGAVTGIIDKMIEEDLVTRKRSVEDRRIVMVTLSQEGDKTADLIIEERERAIDEMFNVLTDKERDEYLRILSKVHKGIKEKNAESQ